MIKKIFILLCCLFCLGSSCPPAEAAVKDEDFSLRGVSLQQPEEEMLQVMGDPLFDNECSVWGRHVKYYTFRKSWKIGVDAESKKVIDIQASGQNFTLRSEVRYGATRYRLHQIFGTKVRVPLDGKMYYIYDNPQDTKQKLMLDLEPTENYLQGVRITSMPLTEEEADESSDWQSSDLNSELFKDKKIDTSALPEDSGWHYGVTIKN